MNLIPCELDISSRPFGYAILITYYIESPPSGKKIVLNFVEDDAFNIPYIIDTPPNSLEGRQISTQVKKCLDYLYQQRRAHQCQRGTWRTKILSYTSWRSQSEHNILKQ